MFPMPLLERGCGSIPAISKEEQDLLRRERHLELCVCGHRGSGKSTLCGRLLFELGLIDRSEIEDCRAMAASMVLTHPKNAFPVERDEMIGRCM